MSHKNQKIESQLDLMEDEDDYRVMNEDDEEGLSIEIYSRLDRKTVNQGNIAQSSPDNLTMINKRRLFPETSQA
jgi:hypothetical protein